MPTARLPLILSFVVKLYQLLNLVSSIRRKLCTSTRYKCLYRPFYYYYYYYYYYWSILVSQYENVTDETVLTSSARPSPLSWMVGKIN